MPATRCRLHAPHMCPRAYTSRPSLQLAHGVHGGAVPLAQLVLQASQAWQLLHPWQRSQWAAKQALVRGAPCCVGSSASHCVSVLDWSGRLECAPER